MSLGTENLGNLAAALVRKVMATVMDRCAKHYLDVHVGLLVVAEHLGMESLDNVAVALVRKLVVASMDPSVMLSMRQE